MAEKQPVLLPRQVVPSKYTLHLEPNLDTFDLKGDVSITVAVHEATSSVQLHARELYLSFAEFKPDGDGAAAIGATSISLNNGSHEFPFVATLTFAKELPVGGGTLRIKYRGELNDQMAGFYRSKYTCVSWFVRLKPKAQGISVQHGLRVSCGCASWVGVAVLRC